MAAGRTGLQKLTCSRAALGLTSPALSSEKKAVPVTLLLSAFFGFLLIRHL